jgi:RES domain-containing protein
VEHDRRVIEALAQIHPDRWHGVVYRHMFARLPPDRENTLGARWNPPEVPAIYTSLSRQGALAEAEYQMEMEPLRPRARRSIYRIELQLASVIDLSAEMSLRELGLDLADLASLSHVACQRIGGAVEYLEHDGMIVPSARSASMNLVIFPNRQTPSYRFKVLDFETLYDPDAA